MPAHRATILLALAGAVAAAAPARGDFLGIEAELDPFGLDGVTPLSAYPGYGGQVLVNVYAVFSQPDDQALGVVGTPGDPFQMQTFGASGFVNVGFGLDTPPPQGLVEFFPALNWDSFYTIGLPYTSAEDELIIVPGTPGPNSDPWPALPSTNMGWLVPPSLGGAPRAQSVAGPDGRVLLMRLSLSPQEFSVGGAFGILVRSNGESYQTSGDVVACCHVALCQIGPDCNHNGLADACDLAQGESADMNLDGVPDECQCIADISPQPSDGVVDVQDLVLIIVQWDGPGTADLNNDGIVDVQDLVVVIQSWGECG